jgi:outer membrane cobalamin receptor
MVLLHLYGSDAVAGVINFHTYHAFDGLKILQPSQETSPTMIKKIHL